jgi:hypothetical protein
MGKNVLHQSNQKLSLHHVEIRAQKFPVSKEITIRGEMKKMRGQY